MALPSILRGKSLQSIRHSAAHPSISLSFTDGTSYEIRVQGYSSPSSSSTVYSLLQTSSLDAVIERAFAPCNGTTVDVSLDVIDCTYITMSDKASRIDASQGEIKWDQNHVALAFKFQPRAPPDAMDLDSIPEHKPRWHCFWATKEEFSEAQSFSGFQDCVHRSYDDVYLHPKGEKHTGCASTPNHKSPLKPSWGRRRGSHWTSTDHSSSPGAPSVTEQQDRTNRSRARSRSPMKTKSDSTTHTPRSHTQPDSWSRNHTPSKPLPINRRGSEADATSGLQSSSWASSPNKHRNFWKDSRSSRPESPAKLDISWTPRRNHSPFKNSVPRSASPTKSWSSSHLWPETPTKMRSQGTGRAQLAPPLLSFSSQGELGEHPYHPSTSPTRDSIFSNGSNSSDISTPSLTNSASSEPGGGGWLIVENGAVRSTAVE